MWISILWGVIRHIASVGGGGLAIDGIMTGNQWNAILGGVAAIVSVIGSVINKTKQV